MMTKKAQVVMLPTEKVFNKGINQRLIIYDNTLQFCRDGWMMREGTPQHLYFTTDDEIKEGDWVITQAGHLRQCTHTRPQGDKYICLYSDNLVLTTHCRKIVATTNPDLWNFAHDKMFGSEPYVVKYDVAKIPTDFIEAYVREQGKIKEVMLECDEPDTVFVNGESFQELDSVKLKLRSNGTVIIHKVQEKKYNYDDLIQIRNKALGHGANDTFSEWFNENYPE